MAKIEHSPQITGAYSYQGESYRIKDGIIEIDDAELANEIAASDFRLEVVEIEETPTPEPEETTFHCGVNDCSREVESEDATCWQH